MGVEYNFLLKRFSLFLGSFMQKKLLPVLIGNLVIFSVADANPKQVTELEEILVSETPFSQKIGTQKITEDKIALLPTKNGNISELLRYNPNVRFANTADSSKGAGEIAPNEVSIHGESFYNNNYTINGLSNNDNLNPEANNDVKNGTDPEEYSPTDLPSGGTQSFWVDSSLLSNVEVFDSNISARYGRFTGGVINAELKDPNLEKASGKVFYRTTRDSWADFHFQEGKEEQYNKAQHLGDQPKFTKHQYGVALNQPLSENASLLFSYNRTESVIPFHHSFMNQWDKQRRVNETYLLKGIYLPNENNMLRASVMYSPHRSIYFKKNVKDGKFTNAGGGILSSLEWEKQFDWGKMVSILAYKKSGNLIQHEQQHFYNHTYANANNNPNGFCSSSNCKSSQMGGYGTFLTEKETWTAQQNYTLASFDTLGISHKLKFGWEVEFANAKYQREQDSINYIYTDGVLRRFILHPQRDVKVNDNVYSAYIEDHIDWKNINLNLGLRFDRSQFLGNNDIAPRFSATYDVFGDQTTRLFGGINRYYSGSVLTYKLRNGIGIRSTCTAATNACSDSSLKNNYDVAHLKTPYSDEYVLGISQKFFDTNAVFKWVNRHSRNQFVRTLAKVENGFRIYQMSNDGRGENDTFSLEFYPDKAYEFKYVSLDWKLGANLTKTKKNYSSYASPETGAEYGKAIVNGKLTDLNDLPASDYNTPWSAFLNVNTYFPALRLNWSHHLSYSSGSKDFTSRKGVCPVENGCGDYIGEVLVYDEHQRPSHFMLDWRFVYKQPVYKDQFMEVTLDVNNVLNRKVLASSKGNSSTYKMGRNFWLGLSYHW